MSAPRFYCPVTLPSSGLFELPPDAAHHAIRVLRLRAGDAVQIFDGAGHACDASISAISGKRADIEILRACPAQATAPRHRR
jgi:16S rRNA (uracil1498-N3)-methyltransferase